MQVLPIQSAQRIKPVPALRIVASIAAALLAALLLGALLASDWTLPMDPAISAAFTA